MEASKVVPQDELTLQQVEQMLIGQGRGREAIPILHDAIGVLESGGGFELDDLLSHLRGTGCGHVAEWVREAIDAIVQETRHSGSKLLVRHQVLWPDDPRPEGAAEVGFDNPEDLWLKVAHAFEGPSEARKARYAPLATMVGAGDRVVDIGCGDGTLLELVRERGGRGIGIDLDREKVAVCRRKGLDAVVSTAQAYRWDRGNVDAVTMLHIVEHLTPRDVLTMLGTAVKSLSEKGRVLLVTPNIEHPVVQANFWLDVTHVRPYPELLLVSMLSALGFPYLQSGTMADGFETWAYGFLRPSDRLEP